jgi:hypothetical protein
MRTTTAGWSWGQSDRADSRYVSVILTKKNHSIAIAFPRPQGWSGNPREDQELVRAILFGAAEEPWESGTPLR